MEFRDYYNSIFDYLNKHPGQTILDYDNPPGPKTHFIILETRQKWFTSHLEIFQFINCLHNQELKKRLLEGVVSIVAPLNNRIPYENIEAWFIDNNYHTVKIPKS